MALRANAVRLSREACKLPVSPFLVQERRGAGFPTLPQQARKLARLDLRFRDRAQRLSQTPSCPCEGLSYLTGISPTARCAKLLGLGLPALCAHRSQIGPLHSLCAACIDGTSGRAQAAPVSSGASMWYS